MGQQIQTHTFHIHSNHHETESNAIKQHTMQQTRESETQKLRVRSVLQGIHHIRFVRQVLISLISLLVSRGVTLPISVSLAPMEAFQLDSI